MANLSYSCRKVDITPEESVLLAGYANRTGTSQEVHRPLSSRCLVLRKGANAVCIVVNDFMEVPPEIVREIRQLISQQTRLSHEQIIIVSIHTHSAPLMERGVSQANDNYIQTAVNKIADNAVLTISAEEPPLAAEIRAGRGICEIGANRKLIVPKSGPAYRISDLQGVRDTEVNILQFFDESGQFPVTIFNYACHPVTLGFNSLYVSPDYPGKAREIIESQFGGEAIFLNGAAANINPLTEQHTDPQKADDYGTTLGEAVVQAEFQSIEAHIDLKLLGEQINIPYRDQNITAEFIKQEVKRKSRQTTEFFHWQDDLKKWSEKIMELLERGEVKNDFSFENTVLKLGPVLFFFSQGELFVEYQIAMKQKFPDNRLFCVGYAHGEGAYIPTAKDYEQIGYETDQAYIYQGLPSPFTRDIENIYLEKSEFMIKKILNLVE